MRNKTGNIGFYVYDAFYHSTNGTFSFVPEIGDKTNLPFGKPNHFLAVSSRIPLNYNTCHMQLFMKQRSTANYSTPYKFSGKEKDEETSYSYFGARYYMSDVSVWLSVDPLRDKYPNQSSFSYVGNRPVMVVDPNGEDEWELNQKTGEMKNVNKSENDVVHLVGNSRKGTYRTGDKLEYTGIALNAKSTENSKGEMKTSVNFSSTEAGKQFYDFAIDKTVPEWSYAITAKF